MSSRRYSSTALKLNSKKRKRDRLAVQSDSDDEEILLVQKKMKTPPKEIVVHSEHLDWVHWVVHPKDWALVQPREWEGDMDWDYGCADKMQSFRSHPRLDSIIPKNGIKSFRALQISMPNSNDPRGCLPQPWIYLREHSSRKGISYAFNPSHFAAKITFSNTLFAEHYYRDSSIFRIRSHVCKDSCDHSAVQHETANDEESD